MFDTLLESKVARSRSAGGAFASVTAHSALIAAAVWATVAMAAGGSSSGTSTSSPAASYDGPHAMFAASGGSNSQGDCPNMGDDNGGSGGGSSTTPSTTTPSTAPSTQDGSSNSGL